MAAAAHAVRHSLGTLSRLDLGAAGPLSVRAERVSVGLGGGVVRLLYAGDLHFSGSWTERPG